MHALSIILMSIILAACAPLSKHDSVLGDAGEVMGRAILCPVTLCLSEMGFYDNWKRDQRQQRYAQWYQSLTPEQQDREDQRQHEQRIAATQALGMAMIGGPILRYTPPARITPPMHSMPTYGSQQTFPRLRLNCTSQQIGGYTNTDCY